jgi:hypothetical protein
VVARDLRARGSQASQPKMHAAITVPFPRSQTCCPPQEFGNALAKATPLPILPQRPSFPNLLPSAGVWERACQGNSVADPCPNVPRSQTCCPPQESLSPGSRRTLAGGLVGPRNNESASLVPKFYLGTRLPRQFHCRFRPANSVADPQPQRGVLAPAQGNALGYTPIKTSQALKGRPIPSVLSIPSLHPLPT